MLAPPVPTKDFKNVEGKVLRALLPDLQPPLGHAFDPDLVRRLSPPVVRIVTQDEGRILVHKMPVKSWENPGVLTLLPKMLTDAIKLKDDEVVHFLPAAAIGLHRIKPDGRQYSSKAITDPRSRVGFVTCRQPAGGSATISESRGELLQLSQGLRAAANSISTIAGNPEVSAELAFINATLRALEARDFIEKMTEAIKRMGQAFQLPPSILSADAEWETMLPLIGNNVVHLRLLKTFVAAVNGAEPLSVDNYGHDLLQRCRSYTPLINVSDFGNIPEALVREFFDANRRLPNNSSIYRLRDVLRVYGVRLKE